MPRKIFVKVHFENRTRESRFERIMPIQSRRICPQQYETFI